MFLKILILEGMCATKSHPIQQNVLSRKEKTLFTPNLFSELQQMIYYKSFTQLLSILILLLQRVNAMTDVKPSSLQGPQTTAHTCELQYHHHYYYQTHYLENKCTYYGKCSENF